MSVSTDLLIRNYLQQQRENDSQHCLQSRDGIHQWHVEGQPLSGDTWYVCDLCLARKFRG